MEINVWELPFQSPVLTKSVEHTRAYTIALANRDELTICLNADAQYGEYWEKRGNVELRIEAIIVHETLHLVLEKLEGQKTNRQLDGNSYCPIDNWNNDYAISRPVGVSYPGHRGFWRHEW